MVPELEDFARRIVAGDSPADAYRRANIGTTGRSLPQVMTETAAHVAELRAHVPVKQAVPAIRGHAQVREFARQFTAEAILGLVDIGRDALAPHSARAMAWQAILDRGHGKPEQKTEIELSVFEGLPPEKRAILDAALELLMERERSPAMIDVTPN